jgi:dTDP-4-dehydrorhamnose reductase
MLDCWMSLKSTTVLPVPSTHFSRKAKRPARAVLLNTQLTPLRPWQEALADFLTHDHCRRNYGTK